MTKSFITTILVLSFAAAAGAAVQDVTLAVPGMNCVACPMTVKTALMKVNGVQRVEVSYEQREAQVTFDDTKTNVEALTKATENAGYPSTFKK